jgi:membrane protease YdiL (CAAX protease family)
MPEPAPLSTTEPPVLEGSAAAPEDAHRTALRLVAAAEVVLCSGIPTQVVLGTFLSLLGLGGPPEASVPGLPFLSGLLLADTVVLISLMVWLMRLHGESPRQLWLGTRPVVRETLLGVALVPAIFLTVVVLLNTLRLAAPWLHNVPSNPFEEIASGSRTDAAVFGLVAILAGGVREELQRAFLLRRFEQHLGGSAVGVAVLSVGFGLGHYVQGWDAILTTGVLGFLWAVMYLRRRSSLAPLVSHAGFNSIEVLRVAILGA